jgi:hypothetical protein
MNNQSFDIIEPSFFQKIGGKGENVFYEALTIRGKGSQPFETIKKCDKAINSSLSIMSNGMNIFEEINNRLINTINYEINSIVKEMSRVAFCFDEDGINELKKFINGKFKVMNSFIKSFSNEKSYAITINDFNIEDNLSKINDAKSNAELILMKDNYAIISQKNIFHYNYLVNRVHGTINYINSKSGEMIDQLNKRINEIEERVQGIKDKEVIRKKMEKAMKTRKVINQLKQFKERKIFIQKSQFQIMDANKKKLFETLEFIKEYMSNVISNFKYYLDIGAFNQTKFEENILFIRKEQLRMLKTFKNIF